MSSLTAPDSAVCVAVSSRPWVAVTSSCRVVAVAETDLEELCAYLARNGSRIWVAPLAEIARFVADYQAATAAVAGSPHPSPRESEVHLRRSVLDLVGERLDYPAIARHRGWQGTVTLRLQIEPDGRISRLDVDRTSGYPVLDRAAVKSLQLASVPQAGRWLHGRALELLVPVEYRLVEG